MRGTAALVWICVAQAACATLPHATPQDVERTRSQFPAVTLEDLEAGRRAYVARCSGCHALYLPHRYAAEKWAGFVEEMEEQAKLRPGERALITQFLTALSARPAEGSPAPGAR